MRLCHPVMIAVLVAAFAATPLLAGQTNVAFAGLKAGQGKPVEITSDMLSVDQAQKTATFSGHVLVTQGELKLASETLGVIYVEGNQSKIDTLTASGGVTLTTPAETATADKATYDMTHSQLTLTGNVTLVQGGNRMSGQTLVVDLKAGTGHMDGGVRTLLTPGSN